MPLKALDCRKSLLHSASLAAVAICLPLPAFAQAPVLPTNQPPAAEAPTALDRAGPEASRADAAASDIVVTGSRIATRGFTAPTPTTVIGAQDIAQNAQPNIFNTIAQLPSLQGLDRHAGQHVQHVERPAGPKLVLAARPRRDPHADAARRPACRRRERDRRTRRPACSRSCWCNVSTWSTAARRPPTARTRSAAWSTSSPTRASPASRATSRAASPPMATTSRSSRSSRSATPSETAACISSPAVNMRMTRGSTAVITG